MAWRGAGRANGSEDHGTGRRKIRDGRNDAIFGIPPAGDRFENRRVTTAEEIDARAMNSAMRVKYRAGSGAQLVYPL